MSDFLDFLFGGGLQGAAGVGLLTGAYDELGNIGERGLTLGQDLATTQMDQTQFRPFTVTTATGSGFGTSIDPTTGQISSSMSLSPEEQQLASGLQSQAGQFFGTPAAGQDVLAGAGSQAMGVGQSLLGQPVFGVDPTRASSSQATGLGQQFMQQAGMGTGDREMAVYDRMRASMRPEEERQRLGLEERLAAQGRLGVKTAQYGGTPEQLAMSKAQEEARSSAMLGAMQQAQREQAQQAGLGAQFAGLGAGLAGQAQGLGAANQLQALQALQAGQGLFQGSQGLQAGQQQLGLGALGASYMPQAQMLAALAPGMTAASMGQQGQLTGAGLFGEATASGIDALLGSALGQANLMGTVGTGLLSGVTQGTSSSGDTFLDYLRNALGG